MAKVIVALDDSMESFCALEWALQHVIYADGPLPKSGKIGMAIDVLVLIHAQEHEKLNALGLGLLAYVTCLCVSRRFHGQEIFRIPQDHISEDILTRSKAICAEHRVMNVETMLALGDARDVLWEAVLKVEPDLLVMGSHGCGAVKR